MTIIKNVLDQGQGWLGLPIHALLFTQGNKGKNKTQESIHMLFIK